VAHERSKRLLSTSHLLTLKQLTSASPQRGESWRLSAKLQTCWRGVSCHGLYSHMLRLLTPLFLGGMEKVVCISAAKVPIVKIWDPELGLACDMNVNNTLALENTRMVRTYVEADPRVRQLAMILKYWTRRRVVNDAGRNSARHESSAGSVANVTQHLVGRSAPTLGYVSSSRFFSFANLQCYRHSTNFRTRSPSPTALSASSPTT